MEEKIERILRYAEVTDGGLKKAAAEIAKLVDEELTILAKERDEFEAQALDLGAEYGDELAAKEAQLAEMRGALEMADKFARSIEFVNPELVETWPIREAIKQALSAAPEEVLWAGEGTIGHYQAGLTVIDIMGESGGCCDLGGDFGKDGQQVKVIVTKPSGKNALQGQGKAEVPDKEGTMKGLYDKYEVIKTDGSPVDAGAIYFVLRLDTDRCARLAAECYANCIGKYNLQLGDDLHDLIEQAGQNVDEREQA